MRPLIPWSLPLGIALALAATAPAQHGSVCAPVPVKRTYVAPRSYDRSVRPGVVIAELIGFTFEADRDSFVFIGKPPVSPPSAVGSGPSGRPPANGPLTTGSVPDKIDGPLPRKPLKTAKPVASPVDLVRVGQALASCVDCHGKGNSRGKVSLFDAAGVFRPNVSPAEIWESIESGAMPKRGSISEADKAVVKQWFEQTKGKP